MDHQVQRPFPVKVPCVDAAGEFLTDERKGPRLFLKAITKVVVLCSF